MRPLALLFPALLLAACSQANKEKSPDPGPATASPAESPAAAAPAPIAPAVARKVSEANDVYGFDYAYPAAAAAIPSLKAWLDADLDKQKAELASEAQSGKAEAAKNDYPFRPYSRGLDWQVVTETPGWLSLSSMVSADTGGAHPNYWFDAILWDKTANKQRDPKNLFISTKALAKAIQPEFCRQIDKQRAKKRGEPIKRDNDDPFARCLDPTDYVIILGSSNRQVFDRIGVLVPPYEAGPYVEGDYEVTVPVTPAILAVVKPEFRSSFAVAR
jgi:hypothetical protein